MSDKKQEEIQKQMEATRTSLTEKLETLEGKVSDTITSTTDAVQDTTHSVQHTIAGAVDAVKDTVESVTDKVQGTVASVTEQFHDTVASVTDKVHETVQAISDTFSLTVQMERRPWVVMGGAVAVGCVLGTMLGSSREDSHPSSTHTFAPNPPEPRPMSAPMSALSAAAPAASDEPSVLETAFAKLKNVGIGYLMGMVRDIAKRELPEALGHRVAEQVDNLTTKFGSEPIREQVLPEWFGKDDASAHDKETDEQRSQDKASSAPRMRALA